MLDVNVLADALDYLTDGVLLINTRTLQVLYVNDTYQSITGFKKEELVGRKSYDFVTGELDESQEKTIAIKVREWEQGINDVFTCRKKDGTTYQANLRSFVVPNDGINILGIVHRDVTQAYQDRQRIANNERLYKAVFDSSYGFTIMCDPTGKVLEVNNVFTENYQFISRENPEYTPLGKLLWDLYSFRTSEKIRQEIKSCFLAEVVTLGMTKRIETHMLRAANDGTTNYVDLSFKPIRDDYGNIVLVVLEGRDISDRKEYERELSETKQQYEAVLAELKRGAPELDSVEVIQKPDNLLERVLRVEAEVASVTGDIRKLRNTVFEDPDRSINILKAEVDAINKQLAKATKSLGILEDDLFLSRKLFGFSTNAWRVVKSSKWIPWLLALILGTQLIPVVTRVVEEVEDIPALQP